jgi:hypothetical protein
MEEEIFFMGKGLDKLFVLRIGETAKSGRLTTLASARKTAWAGKPESLRWLYGATFVDAETGCRTVSALGCGDGI